MSFTGKKFLWTTFFACALFFSLVSIVHAAPDLRAQINNQITAGNTVAGLGEAKPQEVVARVIEILLSIVGITFTLLIVISGYNMLTAAGDEGKVEKAKNTIKACVIGLAITLGAYSITLFVANNAEQVTNQAPQAPVNDKLDFDTLKNDIQNGFN